MSIDYADDTITAKDDKVNVPEGAILVNNSTTVVLNSSAGTIVKEGSTRVHYKYPTITITAKPSCGCGKHYSYKWRTRSFISYCPHCHRYGVLYNAHKYQARYEQELTCKRCGADYCGNCGKEKYSWSRYYLRKC